jgi:hypothetical protein
LAKLETATEKEHEDVDRRLRMLEEDKIRENERLKDRVLELEKEIRERNARLQSNETGP